MKVVSKILVVVMLINMLILPGFSVNAVETGTAVASLTENAQYPLDVEVSTDKKAYGALDVAEITVKLTNVSDNAVNDISAVSTYNNLNLTNKKSVLSVDGISLDSNESYSYSYYATIKPSKLNFFQNLFLSIKLLFIGSLSAPTDNFADGRNVTTEEYAVVYSSHNAREKVKVYYEYDFEIVNTENTEGFADATSELVKETLSAEDFDLAAALNDELYSCRLVVKYDNADDVGFKQFDPDTVILDNTNEMAVLQFNNRSLAENCIDTLKNNSNIEYVEADKLITIDSDDLSIFSGDSYSSDELHTWGKEQIGADKYVNYLENNDKFDLVKVAVVDTISSSSIYITELLLTNEL